MAALPEAMMAGSTVPRQTSLIYLARDGFGAIAQNDHWSPPE